MIKSLKLKNFRKFSDREFHFKDGLNIVWGKNEAGKSTIMSALETLLFADAGTKARSFYDFAGSWQNGEIYLEAMLQGQEGEYLLKKDFSNGSQELKSLANNENFEGYKSVSEALGSKFQIPMREVFEATSFVRQSEIAKLHFSRELRSALQRVMSVSPEGSNLENSIRELEKESQALQLGLHRPSKTVGPLKATQDELASIKQELALKTSAWEKVVNARETGDESDVKLKDLEKQINELETLINNNKKFEEGKKQLADIEKQLQSVSGDITQLNNYQQEMKRLEASMSTHQGFLDNDPVKVSEKLLALKQEIKLSQETIAELEQLLKNQNQGEKLNYLQVTKNREQTRELFKYGIGTLVLGLVVFAIGVIFLEILSYFGIFIVAVGGILLVWALMKFFGDNGYGMVQGEMNEEATGLKKQIESFKNRIEQAKLKQKEYVQSFGLEDVNEFFSIKARFNTMVQEGERLKASLRALLGEKSVDQFNSEQAEFYNRKKEIETTILTDEVKASDMSPSEYLRKRRELDMLLIEQKRLSKDSTRSEVLVEESSVSQEELISLEERQEMLLERSENLIHRQKVLEFTINMLKEVVKTTGQSASKLVSSEVERFLPKLTANRYKDLRLREDYELEVFSSDKNDWIKPGAHLSQGTVDQIFLLARFALAKTVLGADPKYLFLDDPFVTFDSERLGQMREILQELAQTTQIFLFTHNENYKDWGNLTELA